MVKPNSPVDTLFSTLKEKKRPLLLIVLFSVIVWAAVKPQAFLDLWLTHDQQGQLLFLKGDYAKAARRFESTEWQAFSFYGAEEYDNAAAVYSQLDDANSRLAQANARAHGQSYVHARSLYDALLADIPNNVPAQTNRDIVQKLIDEINAMSESQDSEGASKELGDEPKRADGAEKQLMKEQIIEQYSAEQLLLDPALNEMWLRQVQKDPSNFLAAKFAYEFNQPAETAQPEGVKP